MLKNTRKAKIDDVKHIHTLINLFAQRDLMMPRLLNELYENLRDFWVYDYNGKVCGCVALHVVGWENLAEIKCLAVKESLHKKGIATTLLKACLNEANLLGIKKVFVLTYVPEFFKKFGFTNIDKAKLPHKIWAECCNCPKFPDCKEEALIKEI